MMQSPEYSLTLASERRLDDRLNVALEGEALEIGGSRLFSTFDIRALQRVEHGRATECGFVLPRWRGCRKTEIRPGGRRKYRV